MTIVAYSDKESNPTCASSSFKNAPLPDIMRQGCGLTAEEKGIQMIVATEPQAKDTAPPASQGETAHVTGDCRILLTDIRWETYKALADDLGDRHIFLTYDRGSLEIMTVGSEHERYKTVVGRFVELMTMELRIRICSLGSTTQQRKDLQRALESDECYYIANEPKVRGKLHIDFNVDPPPDLAIEIDISRSSIDRQSIYAALRVPELWRFNSQGLRVFVLRADGQYERSESSRCFPFLPLAELERFLKQITKVDETSLLIEFQEWVRTVLLPIFKSQADGGSK